MKRTFLYATLICLCLFIGMASFSPVENNTLVSDILSETNQFRKSKGLAELIIRQELNTIAQKHSANMANGRVDFGHAGFEERNERAKKEIQGLHRFAENVAYGPTSAKEVVTMWKDSPGHRRNMLGPYKYIGVGTATDRHGRMYYTEIFGGN